MSNISNNSISLLREVAQRLSTQSVYQGNKLSKNELNKERARKIKIMGELYHNPKSDFSIETILTLDKYNPIYDLIDQDFLNTILLAYGREIVHPDSKTIKRMKNIADNFNNTTGDSYDNKAEYIARRINQGNNLQGIFSKESVDLLSRYNNEYNLLDNEFLYLITAKLNGGVSTHQDDFLNEAVRNYGDDVQFGGKKKKSSKKSKKSSKKKSSKKSKKGGAKKKKSSKKSKKSTKKSSKKKSTKSKKGGAKKKKTTKKSTKKTIKRRSKKLLKKGGAAKKRVLKRSAKRTTKRSTKRTHKRSARKH